MRFIFFAFLFMRSSTLAAVLPPDERSWPEVIHDFEAHAAQDANDGERDGRRLKALDPKKAVQFLLPFLGKDHPRGFRLKAIGALGWSSFQDAMPSLSAIAQDTTDEDEVRSSALNPGLCYMHHPEAVRIAAKLANDKSPNVRKSAYWVLAHHGTDAAVSVLEQRLRAKEAQDMRDLIYALSFSKNPKAGRIVFDHCDFASFQSDEELLLAYSTAMEYYRVTEAQEQMLMVARQPGHLLSTYYALRYFGSFPREDVVPALIAFIESDKRTCDLYDSVTEFIKSPNITDGAKKKLSDFLATGKVKKAALAIP